MIYINAFIFGGFLCMIAQLLIVYTKMTPARILVLYVVLGVVFTYLKFYDKLVETFGAGASVPIMGFGNILAKGVIKAIEEKGILGILTGGVTAAAAGISAAIFFGFIFSLIFSSKEK